MSETQKNHAPQKCAWCAGTGMRAVSLAHVVSCLVCGGKGTVSVAQPAGSCRQCEGSGRRSANGTCLNCSGTGWSRVFAQA